MDRKVSFYLLTDCHYVSKQNWVEGGSMIYRERGDQIALRYTPELLDAFIDIILADDGTDTVVFTGDNVDDGDMTSHHEFRQRLERLTAAGKRVFVTTATHDYCGAGEDECVFMHSKRYTLTGTEPIPFMRKGGLFDFYRAYGPDTALSVDKESGSYVSDLGGGVRLVMIEDNGNGRSHCGLFEEGMRWLSDQLDAANEAGAGVLVAVHHPVIPPWDVFALAAEHELYGGYKDMRRLLCEKGVRVVFTGHTHVHSIRRYEDDEGRWFLDVATVAGANAAAKMRKVTVDPDTLVCDIGCVGLGDVPGIDAPGGVYEYLYRLNFPGIFERLLPLAAEGDDEFWSLANGVLPVDKLKKHKKLVRFAARKFSKMKLKTAAKFGGAWKKLSKEQRAYSKQKDLSEVVFTVLRHLYPGNAPFTPDTAENIALTGVVSRIEKAVKLFKVQQVLSLIPPGSTLVGMAQDFLYNTRTGDDDNATVPLRG